MMMTSARDLSLKSNDSAQKETRRTVGTGAPHSLRSPSRVSNNEDGTQEHFPARRGPQSGSVCLSGPTAIPLCNDATIMPTDLARELRPNV